MADPLPAAADQDLAVVIRAEHARVLGAVARSIGDLDLAEDAVQEACAEALRTWPTDGTPRNPGAWLTTTARRRALDVLRREGRRPDLELAATRREVGRPDEVDGTPPDERDELAMVFLACHPALPEATRIVVTLRFVFGLEVAEIARVLLAGEAGVAKQLQRARTKIRQARLAIAVPPAERLGERLPSALDCLYLVFTEGYASTRHEDLVRVELCAESIRLTRQLAALAPDDVATDALLALMLLQHSRRATRTDAHGEPVLLADQDRTGWDHTQITEALALVHRSSRRGATPARAASYLLQARIAAVHAQAPAWEATDWSTLAVHYDELLDLTASPVVALNRAVAVSFDTGPRAALDLVDALATDQRVADSHQLHSVRADLLRRLHDPGAVAAYRRAAELARSPGEQRFLTRRADELEAGAAEG